MSTDGPLGFNKGLFQELCRQLASLVDVPTPAEIRGTVVLFDTTISKAVQRAATSSISLKWSISSKLCTVTPSSSLTLIKSSSKSLGCKFIKVTLGIVSIGDHSDMVASVSYTHLPLPTKA